MLLVSSRKEVVLVQKGVGRMRRLERGSELLFEARQGRHSSLSRSAGKFVCHLSWDVSFVHHDLRGDGDTDSRARATCCRSLSTAQSFAPKALPIAHQYLLAPSNTLRSLPTLASAEYENAHSLLHLLTSNVNIYVQKLRVRCA
jgi:hypothetical protein